MPHKCSKASELFEHLFPNHSKSNHRSVITTIISATKNEQQNNRY